MNPGTQVMIDNLVLKYNTLNMGTDAVESVKADCFNMLRDAVISEGMGFCSQFEMAYKIAYPNEFMPGAYRSAKSVLNKAMNMWLNGVPPAGTIKVSFDEFLRDSDGNYLGKSAISKMCTKPKAINSYDKAMAAVASLPVGPDLTDEELRMVNITLFNKGYNTGYVP